MDVKMFSWFNVVYMTFI